MLLASIAIRCYLGRHACWLFERKRTRFGTYLCPNFAFTWQIALLCFLAGLEVIVFAVARKLDVKVFFIMEGLMLVGLWLSTLLAAWGMQVSKCVEAAASGQSQPRWSQRPWVLHLWFIGFLAVAISLSVTLSVLLAHFYDNLTASFTALFLDLQSALSQSLTLDPSSAAYAALLRHTTATVQARLDAFDPFYRVFQATYYWSAASDLVVWAFSLCVAVPHLLGLWRRLYTPAEGVVLSGKRMRDLTLSFAGACATVAFLSIVSLAYALMVLIALGEPPPAWPAAVHARARC